MSLGHESVARQGQQHMGACHLRAGRGAPSLNWNWAWHTTEAPVTRQPLEVTFIEFSFFLQL
ncbi:hypothetical protein AHAS_Ahas06G0160100 [Arachis hypogaea]